MSPRPTIGVRMPPWTNSSWLILEGITDYTKDQTAWKIVTEDNSYGEMEEIKIGVDWEGDGVILYRATEEELAYFQENNIAVCLLSSEGPDAGFPRVIPDNRSIGQLAAKHLLETGAQSFGFLARGETLYKEKQHAPGERVYARERLSGYVEKLRLAGHEPNVFYLDGYPLWKKDTWRKIEKAIAAYLQDLPPKTALFCIDDALAAATLRTAEKQNINVPEDLMVLGFGNIISFCHASLPTMSSIVYPARAIGQKVAKLIDQQLKSEGQIPQKLEIQITEIKERESTTFVAIEDPEIAALVKWIRRKAPVEAIQVSDLLDHTSYSLSSVKVKFSQLLGRSPKEEIKQVRLSRLKLHLSELNKDLADIAAEMDFRSTEEMSRFFQREEGVRPNIYRQQLSKK